MDFKRYSQFVRLFGSRAGISHTQALPADAIGTEATWLARFNSEVGIVMTTRLGFRA